MANGRFSETVAVNIHALINCAGAAGLVVLGAGLAAVMLDWHRAGIPVRAGIIAAGAGAFGYVLYLSRLEFHILSYFYLIFMGMLLFFHVVAFLSVLIGAVAGDEKAPLVKAAHPLLQKARRAERSMDFAGAVRAYDQYLEKYEDPASRGGLAEVLIKAGNSKRALSVLTLAFTEAEDPRLKITLGIRLAEVILVTGRDPVAARTQLEQVREIFAGTEHEAFIEDLAARMIKRVAEGRYLKAKPDKPRYNG